MAEKEYIERGEVLSDIGETVIFTVRNGVKLPTAERRMIVTDNELVGKYDSDY